MNRRESARRVKIGPEDRTERVREMFNSIAPRYDLMNSVMTFGLDKSWRRFRAHRSGLKPGGCGLDLCCGTAMLTMELASAVSPSGIVRDLGFSEKVLAVAMKNLERFALKDNVRLIRGQAVELPFRDNTFDCATIGWGLRSLPDIPAGLQEMTRVVKPGGKMVSLDVAQLGIPKLNSGTSTGCISGGLLSWASAGLKIGRPISIFMTPPRPFLSRKSWPGFSVKPRWSKRAVTIWRGGIVAVVEGKRPIP